MLVRTVLQRIGDDYGDLLELPGGSTAFERNLGYLAQAEFAAVAGAAGGDADLSARLGQMKLMCGLIIRCTQAYERSLSIDDTLPFPGDATKARMLAPGATAAFEDALNGDDPAALAGPLAGIVEALRAHHAEQPDAWLHEVGPAIVDNQARLWALRALVLQLRFADPETEPDEARAEEWQSYVEQIGYGEPVH